MKMTLARSNSRGGLETTTLSGRLVVIGEPTIVNIARDSSRLTQLSARACSNAPT